MLKGAVVQICLKQDKKFRIYKLYQIPTLQDIGHNCVLFLMVIECRIRLFKSSVHFECVRDYCVASFVFKDLNCILLCDFKLQTLLLKS